MCCSFVPADAVDKGDSMVIGTPKLFAISSATKGSKALVLSAKLEQVREFRTLCSAAMNLLSVSAVPAHKWVIFAMLCCRCYRPLQHLHAASALLTQINQLLSALRVAGSRSQG